MEKHCLSTPAGKTLSWVNLVTFTRSIGFPRNEFSLLKTGPSFRQAYD